ncbi:hypothetical protein D9M71_522830 [compost metagenome]
MRGALQHLEIRILDAEHLDVLEFSAADITRAASVPFNSGVAQADNVTAFDVETAATRGRIANLAALDADDVIPVRNQRTDEVQFAQVGMHVFQVNPKRFENLQAVLGFEVTDVAVTEDD